MPKPLFFFIVLFFSALPALSQVNQNKLIRYAERDRKIWLQKQIPANSSFQQYTIPLPVSYRFYNAPVRTKKIPKLSLPKSNYSLVRQDSLPLFKPLAKHR